MSMQAKPETSAPWILLGSLGAGIVAYWAVYIQLVGVNVYYAPAEVEFFRHASFADILGMMNFGGQYERFSPLGFGLIGYLDQHFLLPLLGKNPYAVGMVKANHFIPAHLVLLLATCLSVGFVMWRIFQDAYLSAVGMILIGFNDAIPFELRFVSTLVCHVLQMAAIFVAYFLVRAAQQGQRADVGKTLAFIVLALGVWEQGIGLTLAVLGYLGWQSVAAAPDGGIRSSYRRLFVATSAIFTAYLVLRVGSGAKEALTNNREASYFFQYGNPLLMLDDLLLNASGLIQQSMRQFFPLPPLSMAVMLNADMNELNLYNATYAQYPNMFYRQMGLWYSGFAFALFLFMLKSTVKQALDSRDHHRNLLALGLLLLVFGMAMHLPIMHRDYFYIPGFTLGYKTTISYVGFVFLTLALGRGLARRRGFVIALCAYLVVTSMIRTAALQLPQRFPW